MASTAVVSKEDWSRAVLSIPPDFLRLTPSNFQVVADHEAAMALHQQQIGFPAFGLAANTAGRLSITVAQAKLVKNYGLTRMDPYVRIRVGHYIYETQTDQNGGKTPRWNRVFHTQLPNGVNKIFLEIYDECNFTMDELIAWAEIKIPEAVIDKCETHEDWYALCGKSGDHKEGMIDLVLSFTPASCLYQRPVQPTQQNVVIVPNVSGRALPVYVQPQPTPIQQIAQPQDMQQPMPQALPPIIQPLTDEDIANLMEMFPNIDKEVIKSIGEANRGDKDATINSLLQLTN
jgi:toll-interacting protein